MFRLPFLRLKPWKKIETPTKFIEDKEDMFVDFLPRRTGFVIQCLSWPSLAFGVVSMFSEYFTKIYHDAVRMLGLWVSITSVMASGILFGIKILKYRPGFHNMYPIFNIPCSLLGVYGVLNESWQAYTAFSVANTLTIIHFFNCSRKYIMPRWVIKYFLPFFLATVSASFFVMYTIFQKEAYTFKLEKILFSIKNGSYTPSSKLKP